MDPIDQFKERYQQYAQKQSTQPVYVKPAGKSFFNKFYVQGLIVGIIIVASSVLIYMNFQPSKQSTTTPPKSTQAKATPAPKIQITEDMIDGELRTLWGDYYNQVKDDQSYRDQAKKKLMEDMAVNSAKTTYAINVSDSDVSSRKVLQFGSKSRIASLDPSVDASIKDFLVRQELEKKVATWRIVDIASSFKATDSNFETNKQTAIASLEKIRTLLQAGKTMKQAFDEAKNTSGFDKGLSIREGIYFTKASGLAPAFSDAIFKANKGDITQVTSAADSFMVAKVIDGNNGQFNSYEEWLAAQTK